MMKKPAYYFRFIPYIIITFFIFLFIYKINVNFTEVGEPLFDIYRSYDSHIGKNSIFQVFTASQHSWFIYSFFLVFTNRYMPLILNMHHQDYMGFCNFIVLAIVYLSFLLAVQYNFEKYIKNKNISILLIFILFPMLIYFQDISGGIWWFGADDWFYAYFLCHQK